MLLLLPKKLYVQFFIKGCHENIFSPSYQEPDVVFAAKEVNSPSIGRELCGKKKMLLIPRRKVQSSGDFECVGRGLCKRTPGNLGNEATFYTQNACAALLQVVPSFLHFCK